MPLVAGIEEGVALHGPEVVVDLSDEPVLSPAARLLLASRALACGVPYVGADFRFEPPAFEPFALPSLAVFGTGKRVGKTAVTGHLARLLARDRDVVVVAMGRGGPAEPEVVEVAPTVADLLERCRAPGVTPPPTISRPRRSRACRRSAAGAAAAGSPARRSRRRCLGGRRAGRRARSRTSSSSTAAAPRSRRSRPTAGILVAHDLDSGLNPYRALISDLVLSTSRRGRGRRRTHSAAARCASTCACGRSSRWPAGGRRCSRRGRRVFDHLDEVVFASQNLADRTRPATRPGRASTRRCSSSS